jgi:hypothetical protein
LTNTLDGEYTSCGPIPVVALVATIVILSLFTVFRSINLL